MQIPPKNAATLFLAECKRCATIDDVEVFPCEPATEILNMELAAKPNICARFSRVYSFFRYQLYC